MALFSFFILAILFAGCAADKEPRPRKRLGQPVYKPLSEEEAQKLMTPTVYYIPVFDQSELNCSETRVLRDGWSKPIATVCKNVFDSCLMQGTCRLKIKEENLLVNVGSVKNNKRRFTVIKNSACRFGKGASQGLKTRNKIMCLDPYYSIAADLSLYSLGDVIHIPVVVGMKMPDDSVHDGYFVIRDSGGNIKGPGRFDFFTGFTEPHKEVNPLVLLGFGDKQTNVPYFKISGDEAQVILRKRNYPVLPVYK